MGVRFNIDVRPFRGFNTIFTVLLLLMTVAVAREDKPAGAPPNAPATIVPAHDGGLSLEYNGGAILKAKIKIDDGEKEKGPRSLGYGWNGRKAPRGRGDLRIESNVTRGERGDLEQRIRLRLDPPLPGAQVVFRGTCEGSSEAFPAETHGPAQERFPLLRNTIGVSRNLRNNAVYDRRFDWVLIGPAGGETRIVPKGIGPTRRTFEIEIRGDREVVLIFRPRFYQKHKNIPFFEPWTYRVWPESVAGWCSWWPYRKEIDEETVAKVATVFAEKLRDYGYRYIQIDDGFQSGSDGLPRQWLETNDRFPGGLAGLAGTIRDKGLDPALWVNVRFGDERFVNSHAGWFITDRKGDPFRGPWIGYGIDGTCSEVIDTLIRPVYRTLREQGWRYVKIDTLRHLLYDSIYPCRDHFESRGASGEEAFRKILAAAREELGRETFLLACWGVLPEVAGIADGCRLGTDGFGPSTLVQYNSWNNVVWRNDPDHVDITPDGEEIIRPATVCMAGAMMMLTDKVEVYEDDAKIEGARRCAPVPFTVPGQLYDFDPSRTDRLRAGLRNTDGGGPPGPIDAEQWGPFPEWWLMEVSRKVKWYRDHWNVLARMSWKPLPETTVTFADLGLPAEKEYVVYEYWNREYLGVCRGSFVVPAQRPKEVRAYAIHEKACTVREKRELPQIISTSRHMLQGTVDFRGATWGIPGAAIGEPQPPIGTVMRGASEVVAGDPYSIVLRIPPRDRPTRLSTHVYAIGVNPPQFKVERNGELAVLTLIPIRSGHISWNISFEYE